MMQLSYGQVEELIAEIHRIPPVRRPALESRLKHFKRMKFPAGVNTGKGRPAAYDASAVLRLLLAFELLQLGMMPERAVKIMRVMRFIVASAAAHGARLLKKGEPDNLDIWNPQEFNEASFFIYMDPFGLSTLIEPYDDGALTMSSLGACTGDELLENLLVAPGRIALINSTLLIAKIDVFLRDTLGIPTSDFARSLQAWSDSFELDLDDD